MAIDALVHNIFELHNAIQFKDISGVDQRVQQIIKQYDLLKPGNHDIEELYQKGNLVKELALGTATPELMARLQNLEKAIVKKVSAAVPDIELEKRIDRQERFADACRDPSVRNGEDLSRLERILNEGPVDLSAITMLNYDNFPSIETESLLTYALTVHAKNDRLVRFLLQNGIVLNPKDPKEVGRMMHFLLPTLDYYATPKISSALIEEFVKAGLDINIVATWKPDPRDKHTPNSHETTLLARTITRGHSDHVRELIYYGAGDINDEALFDRSCHEVLKKAFRLREEMLEKMQKHLPPKKRKAYKELSIPERLHLAKLCQDTYEFRADYRLQIGFIEPEGRVELHAAFARACLFGKLEEAEKMLAQDIDINADLVPHHTIRGEYYPLLNHACMKGDVKLVEFLLKHGAKCNIGSDDYKAQWWPPILECSVYNTPNLKEIRELLLKAGANPNEKSGVADHFLDAIINSTDKKTILANLLSAGMDINISLKDSSEVQRSLLDHAIWGMQYVKGQHSRDCEELAKLLIYHGARIRDEDLKRIQKEYAFESLLKAVNVRDRAMQELLKDHLKENEDLKPLSMDLINIISGYTSDVQLSPHMRVELAKHCFKIKDEG